ncbi:hypothetical protein FRB99_005838 [Tulasnella sp. 403]|nr:hypothetical protein FRB99_005838 [Tulasnella sp. 403]
MFDYKAKLATINALLTTLTTPLLPTLQIPSADLHGKRALVTGSNTGIGKAAALALAQRGAEVYLLCRNREKAVKAQNEIRKETGSEMVFVEVIDFASLESVRGFVQKWTERSTEGRTVDILINNAGLTMSHKSTTEDGLEMTYQVNFLGAFLLTGLLLKHEYFTSDARIVQVSANALYSSSSLTPGTLSSPDLLEKLDEGESIPLSTLLALYGRSKAMQVIWTKELQQRLARSAQWNKVVVQACHPGAVVSNIWDRQDGIAAFTMARTIVGYLHKAFGISNEQGAATPVWLAIADDAALPENRGMYWDRCRWKWTPSWMDDPTTRKDLWRRWESDCAIELGDL